ncbi:MAG: DUF4153 domain-containing protein [Bacteroidetes bacterium]|nr:MAG: DUF4153 domain-containing protein [Bacteroidota bacterium]
MKLPSFSFLADAFLQVCMRFPFTMLSAFTGVGAVMILIEGEGEGGEPIIKLWIMAQLGLALFTGLVTLAETSGWNTSRKTVLQLAGLAMLALYYFLYDMEADNQEITELPRYLGFLLAAHLFVAVAPYLNRRSVKDFWEYNKQLFAGFVVGAVYAVILYSGLALALLAVNELFNLDISESMYGHLFVLLAGIFQTTFFLFHVPAGFEFTESDRAYTVVFKNLSQYILIPIVGLYFLILYAYSLKILLSWNLPHGWVSSLVLGFSVAGIFTYLLNYLLPEYSDNPMVKAYRKWFWWVLLPLVFLLFVAVGRRIMDYGITEPRFYLAHAGVWLLVMCVYFLLSKTDNIKFIPLSLGLFTLVAVVGPLSAIKVSNRSQQAVIQDLLAQYGRFENGKFKQEGNPMLDEDTRQVLSALNFLEDRDALDDLGPLFPVPLDSIAAPENDYFGNRRAKAVARWLGLETANNPLQLTRKVMVYPPGKWTEKGNIGGFRTFYRVDLYRYPRNAKKADRPFREIQFSDNQQYLVLHNAVSKAPVDSFALEPLMKMWNTEAGTDVSIALPEGADIIELTGTRSKARLYLQEARFDADELKMEGIKGLFFVK